MKFIDRKNKIFGKFNASLLIIPFALLIISGIIYYIFSYKPVYIEVKIKGSPGNWWWVTPRPPDWLTSAIKEGDKEYDAAGRIIADVKKVNVYEAGGPAKDIFIKAKLKVNFNSRTKKYRYKGEPVEVGAPIALEVGDALFAGIITKIYTPGKDTKELMVSKIVTVRLEDKFSYEYKAIDLADKMTDGSGITIAEPLDKWDMPAEKETYGYDGTIYKNYSPLKRDIYVKLKLLLENRGNDLFFREEQSVKVGNAIWIILPHYNLAEAYVVSIED